MRNIALILTLIIAATYSLSAQRGGMSSNPNMGGNSSSNSSVRNGNISTNPNLGSSTSARGNQSRRGGQRPGSYSSGAYNSRPGGRPSYNHGHHHGNHTHHGNGHHHGHVQTGGHVHVNVNHSVHHYAGYCSYRRHYYNWAPVCRSAFNTGCYSISSCGFDSDRLRAAKFFVRRNYVTVGQICHIMSMFSFESSRLAFAKYAFGRTCDIQNYHLVFNQLSFNSSRRALDCYIRDFYF